MKGNFLAQFTGEKPDLTFWGLEVLVDGITVVHVATGLKVALELSNRLRQKFPQAHIRMTADAIERIPPRGG